MMNGSGNTNTDSTHNDEGYVEQRFEAPDFMVKWTEEQKAEFAYQLLLSIPTSRSLKVVDRLGPILHRDFFSILPYELAVYILSHVDLLTLVHMGQVSRRWKIICEDQSLWKQLFITKGWKYDQQAITNYLDQSAPPTNKGKTKISRIKSNNNNNNNNNKETKSSLTTPTTTMSSPSSSSSSRPLSLPLAITNDTLYDPTALPTMPGAPLTPSRLRSIRRPGDIFLRFRQRRPLQNPSPTSNSSSTPSMSPISPLDDSFESLLDTTPSTISSMLVNESDALTMQQPSSSTPSTDPEPISQLNNHATDSPTIIQTGDAASIKRGSKLLLYDTMVNRRHHRHSPTSATLDSASSDSRLPMTTPSLSTVPTTIRRSHPTPSYTRISVSSTLRPTSPPPPVGSVTFSALYQRRHHHSTSSSSPSSSPSSSSSSHRHNHRRHHQNDLTITSSSSSSSSLLSSSSAAAATSDPTQHRVIERRPFKNRPISRQHVHYDETALYHYQEENDRRFINWRRLYRNRNLIEKRWRDGQYWMHMFPLGTTTSTSTSTSTNTTEDDDTKHTDWIYCLQFNTQILVSGSRDRTLKIWRLNDGKCLHTLYGHDASVLCLQFDDRFIISGSSDTTMVMWDVTNGKKLKTLMGHSESVLNLRFAGNRLVSSSKDRTIRVWDLEQGTTCQVLRGHRAAVNAVQFKDDLVVSASGDRTIRLWNAVTGVSIRTFDSHSRGIACVEFDGNCIVSGSSDQTIKVWNQATGECLHTMAGHTELVRTLQMDRDSDRIVSGSYDGSIKIWNMNKGALIKSLNDKVEGRILNLQFDYAKIICCTNMSKIFIYDFTYGLDTQFLDTSLSPHPLA